jgi:FAD-dependent monooxygenase
LIANPTLDRKLVNEDSPEGARLRVELAASYKEKHWFHDQNGNMLGYQYVDSPIVLVEGETGERPVSKNFVYKPTTFPGSRAPHVWLSDGKTSILDDLSGAHFNLVDFAGKSNVFTDAAEAVDIPLKLISLDASKEANLRKIYQADLILVRPDGHVSWRSRLGQDARITITQATDVLRRAAGLR